jgi:hypothetical protein
MQYKHLYLAPILALVASTAFAQAKGEPFQMPRSQAVQVRCNVDADQSVILPVGCNRSQTAVRVAEKIAPIRSRKAVVQVKRITRMPWQIGIFQ